MSTPPPTSQSRLKAMWAKLPRKSRRRPFPLKVVTTVIVTAAVLSWVHYLAATTPDQPPQAVSVAPRAPAGPTSAAVRTVTATATVTSTVAPVNTVATVTVTTTSQPDLTACVDMMRLFDQSVDSLGSSGTHFEHYKAALDKVILNFDSIADVQVAYGNAAQAKLNLGADYGAFKSTFHQLLTAQAECRKSLGIN